MKWIYSTMYSNIIELYYSCTFLDNLYHGCKQALCQCWNLPPTVFYVRGGYSAAIALYIDTRKLKTASCQKMLLEYFTSSWRGGNSHVFWVVEWLHSGGRPMKDISSNCRLLSTAHCLHKEQFVYP